jgi:arylsulfatase A-like enzyme/predicted Zn-dependent protease
MRRVVGASLLAVLVAGCIGRSIDPPSGETPVILISVDTLRSDHLPVYGYKGVETPNIDALRADSILFERAYSHTPLTLPSHVTMLTGLLPGDHGVRDNIGFRLSGSIPTLPELLKKKGYATGAAVASFVLRRQSGIARGFDFFDDRVKPVHGQTIISYVQRDGRDTVDASRQWLDQHAGKRPFFFFLHLYDPHSPYEPPEPYRSRYAEPYDGEIAYTDEVIGTFLDYLKEKGVYDRALIIFLSDHGEGLNDHGEEEHGMFLYREALQVPLLVKLPKGRKGGATVSTPAQLVDVFPTILERTAVQPPGTMHASAQSLLALLEGGSSRQIYAETYYPRFHFGWSDMHSLIDGNDHYIHGPIAELYDLSTDPAEKKNVLEANRRVYARLRNALQPLIKEPSAPASIDREEVAKLAALGYVGSTVSTKNGANLPDPKTKLKAFNDIRVAFTMYRKGPQEDALKLANEVLEENPQLTDLWDLKTKILFKMGRHREALEAGKDGLRHVPHSVALLYSVANIALGLGEIEAAEQHAEIAVKIEPGEGHEILAKVALRRGKLDKAEEEAKLALQSAFDPSTALMLLGTIRKGQGRLTEALDYLNQADERVRQRHEPKLQDLYLTRGDVLARLDRNGEAERDFRKEIADYPADPRAYGSLIILLATQRRLDEATKTVFAAIKASPKPNTYVVMSETLKAIGDDRGAMFWVQQGLQLYPDDPDLKEMPSRLARATKLLRERGL